MGREINIKMQTLGLAILSAVAVWSTIWTILQFADDFELRFNPVVKDFKVESIARIPGGVVLYGSMNKLRPQCETTGLSFSKVLPDGRKTLATLDYSKDGGKDVLTRQAGIQDWGPWVVSIPDVPVTLSATVRHRCNPLYEMETDLITFEVPK